MNDKIEALAQKLESLELEMDEKLRMVESIPDTQGSGLIHAPSKDES